MDASSSPSLAMLTEVARTCNVYLIGGSIPEREGDRVYNTCVVVGPGRSHGAQKQRERLSMVSGQG